MDSTQFDIAVRSEHPLKVCYKLLSGAIVDRLKRMEANSLVTNFMLLVAFRFPFLDLFIRMIVTFFLNVLVYFINDFIDVDIDLSSAAKDHSRARYIKEHKRTAFALIVLSSATLLVGTLLYSKSVSIGVICALVIIFLYTDYFKNMAYLDVVGCFIWGMSMAWPAIPDFSWQGMKLILLIGLFTASFEIVQCVKDYEFDKNYNLKTTPIVIGIPKAYMLARGIYVISALYTVFVLGEYQGVLLLIPLFFSTTQDPSAYWMKLRVVFGVVWCSIMARLFLGLYKG